MQISSLDFQPQVKVPDKFILWTASPALRMGGNLTDDLITRTIASRQKYVYHSSPHSDHDDDADISLPFQPTVHGVCPTDYTVNAREDIATDVSVRRDLSGCDRFSAHRQDVSPLAIVTGMVSRQTLVSRCCRGNGMKAPSGLRGCSQQRVCVHRQNYPLSKMISSTQTCNYKFDNQKKHMTKGTCTEKHIFLPLSSQ